jgi:hypothetical protein
MFCIFCCIFWSAIPESGLDLDSLEMLDPDPNRDSMNPDPQLWEEDEDKEDYA